MSFWSDYFCQGKAKVVPENRGTHSSAPGLSVHPFLGASMFSVTRLTRVGYVLVLSLCLSLLLRPSPSNGQYRGNTMPPPPLMPQLSNQMTDDTAGWLIFGRMAGMGGMSGGGGMMGMGGGMGGMGMGGMGMGGMGMGGGMMGMGGGMMGMGGMMMGGMNMMGGMGMGGFAGKGMGGFNGRKAL